MISHKKNEFSAIHENKKKKKNESKNDYMKNTFLSPAHKYNVQNYVKNKNVISYY